MTNDIENGRCGRWQKPMIDTLDSTAKTLKFHHEDTESQSFPSLFMLVSPCLCGSIFTFLQ
jgi:hypothetical protein